MEENKQNHRDSQIIQSKEANPLPYFSLMHIELERTSNERNKLRNIPIVSENHKSNETTANTIKPEIIYRDLSYCFAVFSTGFLKDRIIIIIADMIPISITIFGIIFT